MQRISNKQAYFNKVSVATNNKIIAYILTFRNPLLHIFHRKPTSCK